MDEEYLNNIFRHYVDGKYLEMNLLELAERCGGVEKMFTWLYEKGVKFGCKLVMFKPPNKSHLIRSKNVDMIVLFKKLKI